MNRRRRSSFQPRFEPLESRALLSASTAAKLAHSHHGGSGDNGASAAIVSSHQSTANSNTNLTANLTSTSGATANVSFQSHTEHGNTKSQFSVAVEGEMPNSTLNVSVGGVVVGTIMTDANGNGQLMFKSNPHGNQVGFPANFPTNVAAGTPVTVGTDLTGMLAVPSQGHHGDNDQGDNNQGDQGDDDQGDHDHGEGEAQTRLTANLTGTGTATGTVSFTSETDDGVTNSKFTATVMGAAANSTLNVAINGVTVGTIMTDANGNGSLVFSTNPKGTQLPFPANFPTSLASGATVTIGTVTGTLTSPTKVHIKPVTFANLTGTIAATGTALFVNQTIGGQAIKLFAVNVKGAMPNSSLAVSVGGTMVGTITVDASGNGSLVFSSIPFGTAVAFPANFPTNVGAGSAITVGTILNGTLA